MTAPERITMQPCAVYGWLHPDRVKYGTEYIRADLHDATKAQLAKAVEALRSIGDRPSKMVWGEGHEKAEAIRDMEKIAEAVLAEIEKGEPK